MRGARTGRSDVAAIRLGEAEGKGMSAVVLGRVADSPGSANLSSTVGTGHRRDDATKCTFAMRLELACAFGLRVCEMIMIDPVQAHRGDCFVVDVCDTGVKLRRRIVLVEHPAQREAADKAVSLFRASTPLPGDLHGSYAARYQQIDRRCARVGVDLHQLRKPAAETMFPTHVRSALAGDEIEAVPDSFPPHRLGAAVPIGRSPARLSRM